VRIESLASTAEEGRHERRKAGEDDFEKQKAVAPGLGEKGSSGRGKTNRWPGGTSSSKLKDNHRLDSRPSPASCSF